jgi:hypothetical protein
VRDELFLMLPAAWAPRALARLRDLGLTGIFFPGSAGLSGATWTAALSRVRALHRLGRDTALPLSVRRRLRVPLAGTRPRETLVKWGALLAATGGAESAHSSTARLKLGAREGQLLATLLREEERAAALLRAECVGGREMHRFVRAAGGWAVESLLFAASRPDGDSPGAYGTVSPALLATLEAAAAEEAACAAPLLSGVEVMNLLDLPAGPAIGRWLDAVALARAERIVTTPAEARAWLLKEAERKGP